MKTNRFVRSVAALSFLVFAAACVDSASLAGPQDPVAVVGVECQRVAGGDGYVCTEVTTGVAADIPAGAIPEDRYPGVAADGDGESETGEPVTITTVVVGVVAGLIAAYIVAWVVDWFGDGMPEWVRYAMNSCLDSGGIFTWTTWETDSHTWHQAFCEEADEAGEN